MKTAPLRSASRLLLALAISATIGGSAEAASLRLAEVISDNMVLQRGQAVPIWGWADPGTPVAVKLADFEANATTDADGKWRADLPSLKPGGPFDLTVTAGSEVQVLHNVLVGDVWVASGQSNMRWTVGEAANGRAEVAAAGNPQIRLFDLPSRYRATPDGKTRAVHWEACSPETISDFSAVGYFFGRDIQKSQGVPVGIISASVGGTAAELWTSREALAKLPGYAENLLPIERVEKMLKEDSAWKGALNTHDKGLVKGQEWWLPATDDSAWEQQPVPGAWEEHGLVGLDGVVWYRTTFMIPPADGGKVAKLELGSIGNAEQVWVNGKPLDAIKPYEVPAGALVSGKNVIVVRINNNRPGPGGFLGKPEELFLSLAGSPAHISLADPNVHWRRAVGIDLKALPPKPKRAKGGYYLYSTHFNGMIAPVIPYAVRGVIWYQGEANVNRAHAYRELFPALIADWRAHWAKPELPFLYVQIANYRPSDPLPVDDARAELREAQALSLSVPHTAMATAIDIGEADTIHPLNKQEVGRRLALAAKATVYGEKIEYSGPIYTPGSAKPEDHGIRVSFTHAKDLTTRDKAPIQGFAIAGADRKFVWADATIKGDSVVVSSKDVPEPVAVRYAWGTNPKANLVNKEGLPAIPFRTDDWPGVTDGVK